MNTLLSNIREYLPNNNSYISASFLGEGHAALFGFSIVFVAILIASYTDLRTREVPDTLNYGLLLFALSFNALLSIVFSSWQFILSSILGASVFYAIGWAMSYTGQWGGGDSKMLFAMGGMFGLPLALQDSFMLGFFLNLLFAGAIYGLIWSAWLAFSHRKKFLIHARKISSKHSRSMLFFFCIAVSLIALFSLLSETLLLSASLPLMIAAILPYALWVFAKAVEQSCMVLPLPPSKVTEGDWIAKDVIVKGNYICGPKDLGISKKQIKALNEFYRKKLVKTVLVKQGIPFIPSFLLAFIITLLIGNPFLYFLSIL